MSHTYGNGNSGGNNYISKKRCEDDIPMDNRYHYDKYDKFDKYGNHGRYNNINYIHSKPPQGNNYYNATTRYRNNYYNNSKPFHTNNYSNKLGPKRDYKKPFQKYPNPNTNKGIRNLSNCDMPSPPPLSLKQKQDGDSLKSISCSTSEESKQNSFNSIIYNGINLKDINKFVSNITNIPTGRGQPIFNQQNINISIKLSPSNIKYKDNKISEYKEENKKWRKEEEDNKEEEIPIFKFPKPSEKLLNYEPLNRNLIKIEENPLENFEIYPKNLYDLNLHNIPRRPNNITVSESINNDNVDNILSLKSCYLLAKISNWRLVTNFVPASSLTEEKFKNIIPLEEYKEEDERKEENEKVKKDLDKKEKKEKPKKPYLVYSEKFDEAVEKSLEQLIHKEKQVKKDIFNKRYIIAQYHYDILKLKNKIKQNINKINYLNIKQENSRNAIDDKSKTDSFSAFS